jgi:two-component system phosphate regulon sensor histidine kinase PhoR
MRPSTPVRSTVFKKIILPFMLVIFLGMVSTLPYAIKIINDLYFEKSDRELASLAEVTNNYLNIKLDQLLAYAQITVRNPAVKRAISFPDAANLVAEILPLKIRLGLSFVVAYDGEGNRIMSLGPNEIISQLDQLDTIRRARIGINMKSIETTPSAMILIAAVPHETNFGMDGVLAAGFVVNSALMREMAGAAIHEVAFISLDGSQVISNADFLREALGKNPPPPARQPELSVLESRQGPYRMLVDELHILNIPRARLVLAASLAPTITLRNRLLAVVLGMAFLGTGLVVLLGVRTARSITIPLERLVALTTEVAGGNLEVQIRDRSNDEIGDLAQSFNTMITSLKVSMDEIRESRLKIARYARELERYSLQLQRDKKETETILKSMRDGLIMIGPGGEVLAINPEAAFLLGRDPQASIGQGIFSVIEPLLERIEDPAAVLRVFGARDMETNRELSLQMTILKPFRAVYRIKTYPVLDDRRTPQGRILVFTNITREKETEDLKNNFLATVSHELRTPLTSIKGSLNLLLDGNLGILSGDQREFIRIASQNADRLNSLVNNLLDLSRIEAGAFRIRKAATDLVVLIHKVLSDIKTLALSRQVTIAFDTRLPVAPVTADQDRMVQLVSNLLDNAIKFSPDKETISLTLQEIRVDGTGGDPPLADLPHGLYFAVSVSDRGAGIPEDQLESIFDKFHQVDMTSTRPAGGSGLGLAIARTIIREHGGAIWAANRTGGGSTFTFVVPRSVPVEHPTAEQRSQLP